MSVMPVTTGDCMQRAVCSVVFSGTEMGPVCDKTSTVYLLAQWGPCRHGSGGDVLSICVRIP